MRTVDLFSGCGGLSLGFELAGFQVVAAYDNWPAAINTYRLNFQHPIEEADLSDPEVHRAINELNADLIIGGPPCQDFSSAGKRDEDLGRGDLSITFAEIVAFCQPKYFLMENVDRILKSKKLEKTKKVLLDAGYKIHNVILDASLCGVPQSRKRFFMVGSHSLNPLLLDGLFKNHMAQKPLTIREYLGEELGIDHYYRHPRSYARRGVFSVDEPSPTIRGVNRPIPNGYPGHPGDSAKITNSLRALTFEERARIQTFPESFKFWGNKSEKEQQIGNAVPVNLAKFVASVLKQYDRVKTKEEEFAPGAEIFAFEPSIKYQHEILS